MRQLTPDLITRWGSLFAVMCCVAYVGFFYRTLKLFPWQQVGNLRERAKYHLLLSPGLILRSNTFKPKITAVTYFLNFCVEL